MTTQLSSLLGHPQPHQPGCGYFIAQEAHWLQDLADRLRLLRQANPQATLADAQAWQQQDWG